MLSEPDGAPLGLALQSGEPSLALDQRQVAQVVAIVFDQRTAPPRGVGVGSAAHGSPASVVADDHRLAVDQERRGLDAEGSFNDGREAVRPVMAVSCEAADAQATNSR
jgi:hypothetical protein